MSAAQLDVTSRDSACVVLSFGGRLDAAATGELWRDAMSELKKGSPSKLVLDASGIEYCDSSGAALLAAVEREQLARGGDFELSGVPDDIRSMVDLVRPDPDAAGQGGATRPSFISVLGKSVFDGIGEFRNFVVFVGQLFSAVLRAVVRPSRIRFKDVFSVAENAGVGALLIVGLIGFLLGLILSFQSAISMRRFGAEIFIADLLGLSMMRELGPLMASIMLTARSGSAFAAEIGTMKVNEEVDALQTMGLEPVQFLVVPRVLAGVAVVPVLALWTIGWGLVGGWVVMWSLGFPLTTYVNRIVEAASLGDLMGGLFKALFFGVIVAAVGCMRGLQTKSGAGAVGESTTSAVVSGITLIAIADGLFAVIFYVLGI